MMTISVAVVEDDKFYNNALKKVIDAQPHLVCVAQYFNIETAELGLTETLPSVVLLDVSLPDGTGIELLQRIKPLLPNCNFIMCTSYQDEDTIYQAIKYGATGYLVKGDSLDKIVTAIADAHNGGAPMSMGIAKKVLQFIALPTQTISHLLTATETSILQLLAQGMLYKEVAHTKGVTIDTIKKHAGNIYRKLQVNNKIEAINIFNKQKN